MLHQITVEHNDEQRRMESNHGGRKNEKFSKAQIYGIVRDRNFHLIYLKSYMNDDISVEFEYPDQKICPIYPKSNASVISEV